MSAHKITLVQLYGHGSELGLFLNGAYIDHAEFGDDSVEMLRAIAGNIAAALNVADIEDVEYDPGTEWQWPDVEKGLNHHWL